MPDHACYYVKFPINRWKHLYSLEQAILHASEDTGRQLIVDGASPSVECLSNQKLNFELCLVNVSQYPQYRKLHGGQMVLATLVYDEEKQILTGEMQIDNEVFDELRNNIIEYSGIDGIFIEATLGLRFPAIEELVTGAEVKMVSFEYAMRS